jgi:hypothetical protein
MCQAILRFLGFLPKFYNTFIRPPGFRRMRPKTAPRFSGNPEKALSGTPGRSATAFRCRRPVFTGNKRCYKFTAFFTKKQALIVGNIMNNLLKAGRRAASGHAFRRAAGA